MSKNIILTECSFNFYQIRFLALISFMRHAFPLHSLDNEHAANIRKKLRYSKIFILNCLIYYFHIKRSCI